MLNKEEVIRKYFEQNSFVQADIESFDHFVETELPKITEEIGEIIPTIIPPEISDFKIKLSKIWVEKPQIIEADGSKRSIFPSEARLRALTYSAPIFLEISALIDGVQRETFTAQVGKLPVMVKSKFCNLNGLKEKDLIEKGEDPQDPGGYFILNGNERVLTIVEDLMPNKIFVQKNKIGPSQYTARVFSEMGSYRIPHNLEQMKDGLMYLSFTRFKRIPIIPVIKALGLLKDAEIMKFVSDEKQYDDVYINLYNSVDIKTEEDALEFLAKHIGLAQSKERFDKVKDNLDRYLLPHLGSRPEDRIFKAYNLCKMIKKFLQVSKDNIPTSDKDHYANKKLKLSGDLLADLFRVNLRVLVNDILYNYQRLVKRGKFQSLKIIIRDKLLTSRVKTAMATGSWVGNRKGISQNLQRTNYMDLVSHLQRVTSLLSATQENFEARALHSTHWARLCPIETPEGTSIGLRKNLTMLCKISQQDIQEDKIKKTLEGLGLKGIEKND
jgi:DNA-directed RNA polymerase beta subunit